MPAFCLLLFCIHIIPIILLKKSTSPNAQNNDDTYKAQQSGQDWKTMKKLGKFLCVFEVTHQ